MIILLHSSKTMRQPPAGSERANQHPTTPPLIKKTTELADYLKTLNVTQISKHMQVSPALAQKTHTVLQNWTADPEKQTPAIDCFLGDIYSGFQVATLSKQDREYAHKHLRILSGLYGVLGALEGIYPYRLEMAYRFPKKPFSNLYDFWGESIAKTLQDEKFVINLSSVEYSKAVLPYMKDTTVVAPKFMTIDPKTKEPKFVVVHAKIARGAFARWLIQNRIQKVEDLKRFSELNYEFNPKLSSVSEPVFISSEFGGLGLSVRLQTDAS